MRVWWLVLLWLLSWAQAQDGWQSLAQGSVVLFRHAHAPGIGDPVNFRLDNCATQRNLDAAGRTQALRIGRAFRQRNITVGRVLSSQWCRCLETARLAFRDAVKPEPVFNSFFSDRSTEASQTQAALAILGSWAGPGVLVVITHQVNITALTGIVPASGEGIVVQVMGEKLEVLGRVLP